MNLDGVNLQSERSIFILGFGERAHATPSPQQDHAGRRMNLTPAHPVAALSPITPAGLYCGLSVPDYFSSYTAANGHSPINTGNSTFNNILTALFSTPAAVSLLATLLLDLTIPAAPGERAREAWQAQRCGRPWMLQGHCRLSMRSMCRNHPLPLSTAAIPLPLPLRVAGRSSGGGRTSAWHKFTAGPSG